MAAAASSSGAAAASSAEPAASGAGKVSGVDRSSVAAIAARYRGPALVQRLNYLSEVDASARAEALDLAIETTRAATENVALYAQLCEAAGRDPDAAWVEETTSKAEVKASHLERELNMKLAAQDRGGIQAAHTALGIHLAACGNTSNAISSFMRAREYCTPPQLVENTIHALRAGLNGQDTGHIEALVRQTIGAAPRLPPAEAALLHAALGVVRLERGNLAGAARAFVTCGDALGSRFNDIIHGDDVAVAATLTSLAALDRDTGKRTTQDSLAFRKMVSGTPDAAALAEAWAKGDFGAAVRQLEGMMPSLRRDAMLGPSAPALRGDVLDRIVVDATAPYSRASLASMATRLCIDQEELTGSVVRLIESGRLAARLDAAAGVLVARYSEPRPAVFAEAVALAGKVERDTRATLMRASLDQHGYKVTSSKGARARQAAPGMFGGFAAGLRRGFM